MVNWLGYLIPFITISFGFLPFTFLSIVSGSFWLNSPHEFPLLVFPTVLIGDSIILPIFNYRVYRLFTIHIDYEHLKSNKIILIAGAIVGSFLSFSINIFTHNLWKNDQYTGFMDTTVGKLSVAGWWHCFFSIAEMLIVIMFLCAWGLCLKEQLTEVYEYAYRTWSVFFWFSSFSLFDFLVRHLFIFHTKSLAEALRTDWLSLITFCVSLVILITLRGFSRIYSRNL